MLIGPVLASEERGLASLEKNGEQIKATAF
jgi:hypothetical protein